ncbi:hypothetical protein C1637_24755 [Chryseobacterium lactis]|uniref:Uncharacterized protein n=2 Tax=Chryseobacterium lactis TaxID=1241981 RepID=A0A3G6RRJ9_CHRLC|nr:hypothetical protein EG342_08475 [Chryseobacterium lactis]AZB06938.1 hypothetical protein EG341_24590 [Chryseobacterium lactis]PNW10988.1 hypothetical protein C1637_24755 [Chryseobacterium lactis]
MLLFSINLSAQYKVSEIKKYAFNRCLQYNYSKIDSTFYDVYKDGSGVKSSVIGKFIEDQDLKNKVNDYTIAKTNEYYSKKNNLHFESGDKNTITYDCFDFYESKELDGFIKKMIGIKKSKK